MRIARAVLTIAGRVISPESGGALVKQLPELDQPGRHRGAYRRTSSSPRHRRVDNLWRLSSALGRRHKSHEVAVADLHHLKDVTALPFGERGRLVTGVGRAPSGNSSYLAAMRREVRETAIRFRPPFAAERLFRRDRAVHRGRCRPLRPRPRTLLPCASEPPGAPRHGRIMEPARANAL